MSDEKNEQDALAGEEIDIDSSEITAVQQKLHSVCKELAAICEAQGLVSQVTLINPSKRKICAYKMDFDFPDIRDFMIDDNEATLFQIKTIRAGIEARMKMMMSHVEDDMRAHKHIKQLQKYAEFRKAQNESKEVTQAEEKEVVH